MINIEDYLEIPANANAKSIKNGKDAEDLVKKTILEDIKLNFHIESYGEWMSYSDDSLANVLITDLPFINPTTQNGGWTEFGIGRVRHTNTREIICRIEVKHQDSSGSVFEKHEALSNRVKRGDYAEDNLVVVVSGDIYTASVVKKLQDYYDNDLAATPQKKVWVIYPHELTAKFIITEVEAHYDTYHP